MPTDIFRAPLHKLPGPLLRIGSVEVAALRDRFGYAEPVVRKAMFAKLKAGGEIPEHTDAAVALRMVHRVHIPIVTNDQVHFYIDGVDHRFGEGEMIELDNTRFHAVKNDSLVDRIHLIVDFYHA